MTGVYVGTLFWQWISGKAVLETGRLWWCGESRKTVFRGAVPVLHAVELVDLDRMSDGRRVHLSCCGDLARGVNKERREMSVYKGFELQILHSPGESIL